MRLTHKQRADIGLGERAGGRDNKQRAAAAASPRNPNLFALYGAEFQDDKKNVADSHRGNFDAMTVYTTNAGGKCVTVVAKTPLMEANPHLEQQWHDLKGTTVTSQSDADLNHVRPLLRFVR